MKRRVISAALALCVMLTLLSGTALAVGQHPLYRCSPEPLGQRGGGLCL